jgi:hypothetical protein
MMMGMQFTSVALEKGIADANKFMDDLVERKIRHRLEELERQAEKYVKMEYRLDEMCIMEDRDGNKRVMVYSKPYENSKNP